MGLSLFLFLASLSSIYSQREISRAVDPHSLYTDPEPAVFLNADPDPDPDPDPGPGLA